MRPLDELCGIQQGLEASMMAHKQEVLRKFSEKLEHACQETEEVAFQRARNYIVPAVEVLAEQLNSHKEVWRSDSDRHHDGIAALVAKLESLCSDISQLYARSDAAVERLDALESCVQSEAQARAARDDELHRQIHEVREAASAESLRQTGVESDIRKKLQEVEKEAAVAVRTSREGADEQFRQTHLKLASREEQILQRLQQDVAQCAREGREHADAAANRLHQRLAEATAHAERQLTASGSRAEEALAAAVHELQSRQADLAKDLKDSEGALREHSEALRERLQESIESTARRAEQLHGQGASALSGAVRELEAQIFDARDGLAQELQSLQETVARGDTSRIYLRRALKSESDASKTAAAELSRASAHALDSLEARWRGEAAELRTAVVGLNERLQRETGQLRAEVAGRATQGEVSGAAAATAELGGRVSELFDGHQRQLGTTEAGLRGRCAEVQQEAQRASEETRGGLAALSGDVAELRAATASLATGVVEALRVIGLWEPPLGLPVAVGSPRAGGAAPVPVAVAPAPPGQRLQKGQVDVDDLLVWERAGKSLAACVARQWRQRESSKTPTLLAALDQRLEVEEHAMAKELIRNAACLSDAAAPHDSSRTLPLIKAPASVPAAAPLSALGKPCAPPSSLSQLRQQRAGVPPANA